MKCANCGNELEPKTIYCEKCGQAIQLVPEYNVLEEELLSQVIEEKTVGDSTPKIEKVDSKKKLHVHVWQLACVIALLGIISGAVIVFVTRTNSYDYQYSKGQDAVTNGEYTKAIDNFMNAVQIEETAAAYTYLSICYYFLGEYETCISYANLAIEIDNLYEDAYRYMIYAYVALDQQDKISVIMNSTDNLLVYQLITSLIIDAPEIKPRSGSYSDDVEVEIECTGDYQIFYTLDGSDPMLSGKLYQGPLILREGTTTVNAVCVSSDNKFGISGSETYTVTYQTPGYPMISPSSGTYYGYNQITISPFEEGCRVFYTWDGTDPDESSLEYVGPIDMPYGSNLLSVVVVDKHGLMSDVLRCSFEAYE